VVELSVSLSSTSRRAGANEETTHEISANQHHTHVLMDFLDTRHTFSEEACNRLGADRNIH
jgi:hypothetical protein